MVTIPDTADSAHLCSLIPRAAGTGTISPTGFPKLSDLCETSHHGLLIPCAPNQSVPVGARRMRDHQAPLGVLPAGATAPNSPWLLTTEFGLGSGA